MSPSSSRPEPGLDGAAPGLGDGALRSLLQSLDVGVAVADPLTMQILFENERFFAFLGPDPAAEDRLPARLPALDLEKLSSRLDRDRSYTVETTAGSGARARSLEVEIRSCRLDDRDYLLAECRDVSDRKQAESMLDSYSKMADRNARDLRREKERAQMLLLNLMPKSVYEEMKDFGSVAPQRFDDATILMLDFCGFTEMAVSRDPGSLVSELNDIFSAFDRIVELFNCERMKTIGDAYLAVSGMPEPSSDHAENVARVALRMRRYLERRNTSHREPWLARIGIHSGPVVGSIVGVQKYAYDIFGPGVNLAARLESLSEPMQITISEETFGLIGDTFVCSERGRFDVKGFGSRRLYSLDDEVGGL